MESGKAHSDPDIPSVRMSWDSKLKTYSGEPPGRRRERFLKGPIPMWWLEVASRLPGQALQVAITLWFKVGLTCSDTVTLSNEAVEPLGVSRQSKARALMLLEEAGLILCQRSTGSSPKVTVVRSPAKGNEDTIRTSPLGTCQTLRR